MPDVCWMILFSNHDSVGLDAAASALRGSGAWSVSLELPLPGEEDTRSIVVTDGPHRVVVSLNKYSYVAIESAEIAQHHAQRRPDKGAIAEADRRFELHFDLQVDMGGFNTALLVQHALTDLLGGGCATFMTNVGEFMP